MNRSSIEIWADSFHEGEWCCSLIASIAKENGCSITKNGSINILMGSSYQSDLANVLKQTSKQPKKVATISSTTIIRHR